MTAGRTSATARLPAIPFKRIGGGEAVVLRISGPVTPVTMRKVLSEVRACSSRPDCKRLLLDFRSAIVLMGEDDWREFTREWLRSREDVELGFVTGLEASDPISLYAWAAANLGQVTLSWTQTRAAYAWLGMSLQ